MIPTKFLKLLKENAQLNEFLSGYPKIDILIKKLDKRDINRLIKEYPTLFELDLNEKQNINNKQEINTLPLSITSLTIIKQDFSYNNYLQSKKIRFYIDERNEKIIKIFQN
jgi:hypothetical protein